jgi:hypothetical protein
LDSTLAFVFFYSATFPIFAGGAFYYAYKLTKIAGAFRGWILMITFVVVFAIQALSSLIGVAAIFHPMQIEQYIEQRGGATFISNSIYNDILAAILFAAMFEMYRTFRALQTKVAPVRRTMTVPA